MPKPKAPREVFRTSCRDVGPGGTTVVFYLDEGKLRAVWTNENCPYTEDLVDYGDETDRVCEAVDGSNVSFVSQQDLEAALRLLQKGKRG